jgi:hypothetical protein
MEWNSYIFNYYTNCNETYLLWPNLNNYYGFTLHMHAYLHINMQLVIKEKEIIEIRWWNCNWIKSSRVSINIHTRVNSLELFSGWNNNNILWHCWIYGTENEPEVLGFIFITLELESKFLYPHRITLNCISIEIPILFICMYFPTRFMYIRTYVNN